MNYVNLIIDGFTPGSAGAFKDYANGRQAIQKLMADKSVSISIHEATEIIKVAKHDYYFSWTISSYLFDVLEGSNNVNEQTTILLVEEFLKAKKESGERFKENLQMRIAEWFSIKNENINNLENVFKFSVFSSKEDFVSFLKNNSGRYIKVFSSLMSLYPHHLSEKDSELIKSKLKKTITKLVANSRNSSIVCKGLYSEEIRNWIRDDINLRSGLIKFVPKFSPRDLQVSKMDLGKKILSIYKNDQPNLHLVQEEIIKLICDQYYRYENRILQLLQVDGTSPRSAFATIVKLDKNPSFLCKKYPELKKLQILI